MNSSISTRTSLSAGALFSCALYSLPVAGQTPSPPVLVPAPVPTCYPLNLRGNAIFDIRWWARTENGWYIFWFCRQPDSSYIATYRFCRHGICDQGAWLQTEVEAAMATDKAAALDAADAKLSTFFDCKAEVAKATENTAICTEVLTAIAVEYAKLPKPGPVPTPAPTPAPSPPPPPPPPPLSAFWVKANPLLADGSQATYVVNFAAGIPTRGSATGSRAGPHAPCDPTVRINIFGSSTSWYMLVPNSQPQTIVLCEQAH